jgi:NADP-dependent 3-hydroxy acid dehydrogenase YdfG
MTAFDTAGLFSVRGRRILVTGASSGLGQHFARILAAAGAEVFVGARSLDKLRTLVAEISSEGGRATAVSLDVVQRTSVCSALDQVACTSQVRLNDCLPLLRCIMPGSRVRVPPFPF